MLFENPTDNLHASKGNYPCDKSNDEMNNITFTLTMEQAQTVAYAMQLHKFARADQLKATEAKPDSRRFNVKNAARAFTLAYDAADIIDDAIRAAQPAENLTPLLA